MFEPQDHPDDFQYPGGPPIPPYDSAGWTLAFQMGVQADRILEAFDGPFERVGDELGMPAGHGDGRGQCHRLRLRARTATRRSAPSTGCSRPASASSGCRDGRFRVAGDARHAGASDGDRRRAPACRSRAWRRRGAPGGHVLRPVRIALWDRYGGSMPSGWLRLVLEQFEFPYEVVYPPQLDAGQPAGEVRRADPARRRDPRGGCRRLRVARAAFREHPRRVPRTHRRLLDGDDAAAAAGVPRGGRHRADDRQLDVAGAASRAAGRQQARRRAGRAAGGRAVLRAGVDPAREGGYDQPAGARTACRHRRLLRQQPGVHAADGCEARGLTPIAWFDSPTPLRSGWAWGQAQLQGGVAIAEATVGQGTLVLFGPEITFRAQPHGTFKFLFNGIYLPPAR